VTERRTPVWMRRRVRVGLSLETVDGPPVAYPSTLPLEETTDLALRDQSRTAGLDAFELAEPDPVADRREGDPQDQSDLARRVEPAQSRILAHASVYDRRGKLAT